MASANVNLVRSSYVAWERGDFSAVDWADPDIEFAIADGPNPVRSTGRAGMAELWRDYLSTWEDYRGEVEEYSELDDERVLVFVRLGGRGRTSGLEISQTRTNAANLFHLRDGKVTRLVLYFDRERALADLGLAHEDLHLAPWPESTRQ